MALLDAGELEKVQEAAAKLEEGEEYVASEQEQSTDDHDDKDAVEDPDEVSDSDDEAGDEELAASDQELESEDDSDDESEDDDDQLVAALDRLDERLAKLDEAEEAPPTKSEDEKWYDEYLAREDAPVEDDEYADQEMVQLRRAVAVLEHDRAVRIAQIQLEAEVRDASDSYKSVPVSDIVDAVRQNPSIDVRKWTKAESERITRVEARVESRLRKELKMKKREEADKHSPPTGRSSPPPRGGGDKKKGPRTMKEAGKAARVALSKMMQ